MQIGFVDVGGGYGDNYFVRFGQCWVGLGVDFDVVGFVDDYCMYVGLFIFFVVE